MEADHHHGSEMLVYCASLDQVFPVPAREVHLDDHGMSCPHCSAFGDPASHKF